MKRLKAARTLAALMLAALLFPLSAEAEHYKVVLLGGQSNMDGRANPDDLPERYGQPREDVLYANRRHFGPLQVSNGFGPELAFGWAVADALPDEKFALIKYASGGTSLYEDWAVDEGGDYKRFTNHVQSTLKRLTEAGHTYEIVAMVWVQGESDAAEGRTTAEYQADLTEFIGAVRAAYGQEMPFIYNRLGTNQKNLAGKPFEQISAAQELVNEQVAGTHMVYVDDLTMKDAVHFDTEGSLKLGERLAKAYIDSLPSQE